MFVQCIGMFVPSLQLTPKCMLALCGWSMCLRICFSRMCVFFRSHEKQEQLDMDVKKLEESIFDDIGDVKNEVFEQNKQLTDDIDNVEPVQGVQGPPGKEGPHGVDGAHGLHGKTGLQGQRGARGIAGPPGEVGVEVRESALFFHVKRPDVRLFLLSECTMLASCLTFCARCPCALAGTAR